MKLETALQVSENMRLGSELAAVLLIGSIPFWIPFLPDRWLPKWLRRSRSKRDN